MTTKISSQEKIIKSIINQPEGFFAPHKQRDYKELEASKYNQLAKKPELSLPIYQALRLLRPQQAIGNSKLEL